jgi:tetratricopeptide (TPR) repeat protein
MTRPHRAARAALAAAWLALGASVASAQAPPPSEPAPQRQRVLFQRVSGQDALIQSVSPVAPGRGARAAEPLPPAIEQRLVRAMDLRASGLADRARDTMLVLQRQLPHHPLIVGELGRTHVAREDWTAVERLAVAERTALRDSSLLAPELVLAYERLGRPRESLRVAVAAWAASPLDGGWASGVFFRLASVDPKLALHTLEEAAKPRPWRSDLAVGLARLHALAGRSGDAVRVLREAEQRSGRGGLRVMFADESLRSGRPADSTAALAALLDLAGDGSRRSEERLVAGRRVWYLAMASGREAEVAVPLAAGLKDVPGEQWGPELLLGVVRTLQSSGRVPEARALLAANPGLEQRMPELVLERALASAREGDLAGAIPVLDSLVGAWPAARFMLAETQFFAGQMDSAHANHTRVSKRADGPDANASLDRLYLLEEHPRSSALPAIGRLSFERWRGQRAVALKLADSLWRAQQPNEPYVAYAGIALAEMKLEAGDARGALVPLLAIADSLAGDRLAPLARQRAGDAYATLGDDRSALQQYEECLARYPRAWNSAEVRRRVERLRKARS